MRTATFQFSESGGSVNGPNLLNCLSCRNPYQTPHSLNCLPSFHWKPPFFFPAKCFVASPSQKNRLLSSMPNMTGRPGNRTMETNGGNSESYLARTPCVPLFCTLFNRGGNRRAFRLPGEGGDYFHCTVEPSPGHIWCWEVTWQQESVNMFSVARFGMSPCNLKEACRQ